LTGLFPFKLVLCCIGVVFIPGSFMMLVPNHTTDVYVSPVLSYPESRLQSEPQVLQVYRFNQVVQS
jgi:hypothetical protein